LVLDFGLAKFLTEGTIVKGEKRGSPLYMAPEMLCYNQYGSKADLWSVGVIAYQCIFGEAPYECNSMKELNAKVTNKLPIEISSNDVSPECKDFLMCLLKHDPDERISYEQFFKHPFLDLDNMLSKREYYLKGFKAVQKAFKLISEKQYKEALYYYCVSLENLIIYYKSKGFD